MNNSSYPPNYSVYVNGERRKCKEVGCVGKVPRLIEMWGMGVCKDYHKVELPFSKEVRFESWMKGLCVDCIERSYFDGINTLGL